MNFLNRLFGNDSKDSKKSGESQMQNSAQSINDKAPKIRRIRKSNANLNIITPNQSEMQKWIGLWSEQSNSQDSALRKLFHRTYPQNNDLDEVLVKVATLNDFYSTNIFNIFAVAKHILSISRIDLRLQSGDESLVGAIAHITINGKAKYLYSFATKFCAHHNDKDFAIYDSYVEKMLWHFQTRDRFGDFVREDLRDYVAFKKALNDFRAFYALKCDLKQLDRYLWLAGKTHFARYGK